jgi:hypothetical protein
VWVGRGQIAGMVAGGHQELIRGGAGHVLTPLHVDLDGDDARGWNHALNVQWRAEQGQFVVFRLSANEWHFRRGADGWRVASRVNRPLDGTPEARELFRGSAQAGRG